MASAWRTVLRRTLCQTTRVPYCARSNEGPIMFPSDIANKPDPRDQTTKSFRPKMDPSNTSVLLFPGQGSQFVGMGKKLVDNREAVRLYEAASEVVNYDVLRLCLEGPADELARTDKCQVAILVTSMAAVEVLRQTNPEALECCVAAAGFSLGEFSALVVAGALSFEDAVELVQLRAQAMQAECDLVDSGLMTVYLTHKSDLKNALKAAIEYCRVRQKIEHPVCDISNYLLSDAKVIGGHMQALQFIQTNMKEFGLKRVKFLPVSGAFHTKLMYPAAQAFKEKLYQTEMRKPVLPVHSNVHAGADIQPNIIKKHLVSQIYRPVKWEQIMHTIYQRKQGIPFPSTYEVGPGTQLGTVLKVVNYKAYAHYNSVEV